MKFSIITPTHSVSNVPFLLELYYSIQNQTYSDWEWVVVLNGEMELINVPSQIEQNNKVRIYRVDNVENRNIGYVKNYAGKMSTGDVIVEVDHDDLITENCLQELYEAYQDPTVGFVFSDDAIYHMEDKFVPFNPAYGWTYKKINWRGKELISMDSFAADSRSLSFIWFSPDHVRSWRKTVYDSLGGFNVDMNVCEDHELMIRTYLTTKFHKIDKPLYIYRVTGDNNSINHRNAEIQTKTKELFNKYAWELACKDAREKGLHIVELGGGINPRPGCNINIDMEDGNVKHDLNEGIPLPDNSVGVIYASHILEHLYDKHKIMKEIHRVLADGGWAFIQVPSTDGRGAFQDPTHVSYWNENCFWYYTRADKAMYIRNNDIRFQAFRLETFWWENHIAITDAWLVAIKSKDKRPHLGWRYV